MGNLDLRKTYIYGASALGALKKNQTPAYPHHYEIWYTYAAGFNRSLNKIINDIISAKGKISTQELNNIYNEHLSPSQLFNNRLNSVGSQISRELRSTFQEAHDHVSTVSGYSNSLVSASQDLSHTEDRQVIREIVAQLIAETKKVESQNSAMSEQFATSQKQIMELREEIDTILCEASTDDLTTLANRRHFDYSLQNALEQAEIYDEPVSLLLADIDHFKKFNDSFGHQTGDQVLRLVALTVKQNVSGDDIACRYGGEEFGIILPRTNLHQAVSIAENIRTAVISKEVVKRSTGENLGKITISIGASTFNLGDTPQSIIERADQCLYTAKSGGRNMVKAEADPNICGETESRPWMVFT